MSICNLFYPNKYQLFNTNANSSGATIDVYTFLSDSQKADVSSRAGVVDCSATVNALLVSQGIGTYYFRAGVWLFNSTFVIPGSSQAILGGGIGVTEFKFNNGGDTCVHLAGTLIDGLSNLTLGGFSIYCSPTKTGGAGINMNHVTYGVIDNIYIINSYAGISLSACTYIKINNINCNGLRGTTLNDNALKISSDAPAASMFIDVRNCEFFGGYTGMNGCLIIDAVQNIILNACVFGAFNKGIHITTSVQSNSAFPKYIEILDCSVEGAQSTAAHIHAGHRIRFSNCFLFNDTGSFGQGSSDTHALQIDADNGWSYVFGIKVVNCTLGTSFSHAIQSAANNVLISGNDFKSNTNNMAACIRIIDGTDYIIIGNMSNPADPTVAPFAYYYGLSITDISSIICVANNWKRCTIPYNTNSYSGNNYIGIDTGYFSNNSVNGSPFTNPNHLGVGVSGTIALTTNQLLGGVLYMHDAGIILPGYTVTLPTAAQIVAAARGKNTGLTITTKFINDTTHQATFLNTGATGVTLRSCNSTNYVITNNNTRDINIYIKTVVAGQEEVTIYI